MKLFVNYDFFGGVKGGGVSWGFRRNLPLLLARKGNKSYIDVISELTRTYENQFFIFKNIKAKRKKPFKGGV